MSKCKCRKKKGPAPRSRSDFAGPFEKALRDAEKCGIHVLPPSEHDPTSAEADSEKLVEKYGSADALPLEYARRAIRELKLRETPEYLQFAWAFLKDRIDYYRGIRAKKYRRLRLERSRRDPEAYLNFYNALAAYVPDIPRPAKGKVVQLVTSKLVNSD